MARESMKELSSEFIGKNTRKQKSKQSKQEPVKQMTIYAPASVSKAAWMRRAETGESVSAIATEALRQYLGLK
jgi:hypothetical protein